MEQNIELNPLIKRDTLIICNGCKQSVAIITKDILPNADIDYSYFKDLTDWQLYGRSHTKCCNRLWWVENCFKTAKGWVPYVQHRRELNG